MMGTIRSLRLGLPMLLVAINVAFLTIAYGYLGPAREAVDREKITVRSEIRSMRARIQNLESEHDLLQQNREAYETLVKRGVTSVQDRLAAANLLEELRQAGRLSNIEYQISPEKTLRDLEATKRGFDIVMTPIQINIRGFLDIDIFRLAQVIIERFPGQVSIQSLSVSRGSRVTRDALISIQRGRSIGLVSGSVRFEWRSLRPKAAGQPG